MRKWVSEKEREIPTCCSLNTPYPRVVIESRHVEKRANGGCSYVTRSSGRRLESTGLAHLHRFTTSRLALSPEGTSATAQLSSWYIQLSAGFVTSCRSRPVTCSLFAVTANPPLLELHTLNIVPFETVK